MSNDQIQSGQPVVITWKRVPDYPAGNESYTATAICCDPMGTLTFRRDEDGFLGIAGAGAWACV